MGIKILNSYKQKKNNKIPITIENQYHTIDMLLIKSIIIKIKY